MTYLDGRHPQSGSGFFFFFFLKPNLFIGWTFKKLHIIKFSFSFTDLAMYLWAACYFPTWEMKISLFLPLCYFKEILYNIGIFFCFYHLWEAKCTVRYCKICFIMEYFKKSDIFIFNSSNVPWRVYLAQSVNICWRNKGLTKCTWQNWMEAKHILNIIGASFPH